MAHTSEGHLTNSSAQVGIVHVRGGAIVLESADGQRFALTAVHNWEGFDVGSSNDFAQEVARTGKSKRLMKFLANRKKSAAGEGIPLAEVKKQLGID